MSPELGGTLQQLLPPSPLMEGGVTDHSRPSDAPVPDTDALSQPLSHPVEASREAAHEEPGGLITRHRQPEVEQARGRGRHLDARRFQPCTETESMELEGDALEEDEDQELALDYQLKGLRLHHVQPRDSGTGSRDQQFHAGSRAEGLDEDDEAEGLDARAERLDEGDQAERWDKDALAADERHGPRSSREEHLSPLQQQIAQLAAAAAAHLPPCQDAEHARSPAYLSPAALSALGLPQQPMFGGLLGTVSDVEAMMNGKLLSYHGGQHLRSASVGPAEGERMAGGRGTAPPGNSGESPRDSRDASPLGGRLALAAAAGQSVPEAEEAGREDSRSGLLLGQQGSLEERLLEDLVSGSLDARQSSRDEDPVGIGPAREGNGAPQGSGAPYANAPIGGNPGAAPWPFTHAPGVSATQLSYLSQMALLQHACQQRLAAALHFQQLQHGLYSANPLVSLGVYGAAAGLAPNVPAIVHLGSHPQLLLSPVPASPWPLGLQGGAVPQGGVVPELFVPNLNEGLAPPSSAAPRQPPLPRERSEGQREPSPAPAGHSARHRRPPARYGESASSQDAGETARGGTVRGKPQALDQSEEFDALLRNVRERPSGRRQVRLPSHLREEEARLPRPGPGVRSPEGDAPAARPWSGEDAGRKVGRPRKLLWRASHRLTPLPSPRDGHNSRMLHPAGGLRGRHTGRGLTAEERVASRLEYGKEGRRQEGQPWARLLQGDTSYGMAERRHREPGRRKLTGLTLEEEIASRVVDRKEGRRQVKPPTRFVAEAFPPREGQPPTPPPAAMQISSVSRTHPAAFPLAEPLEHPAQAQALPRRIITKPQDRASEPGVLGVEEAGVGGDDDGLRREQAAQQEPRPLAGHSAVQASLWRPGGRRGRGRGRGRAGGSGFLARKPHYSGPSPYAAYLPEDLLRKQAARRLRVKVGGGKARASAGKPPRAPRGVRGPPAPEAQRKGDATLGRAKSGALPPSRRPVLSARGTTPSPAEATVPADAGAGAAAQVAGVEETVRLRAKSCEPLLPITQAPTKPRSKSVPPPLRPVQPRPAPQDVATAAAANADDTNADTRAIHLRDVRELWGLGPRAGESARPGPDGLGEPLSIAVPCSEHTLGPERGKRRPGGDPLQVRAAPVRLWRVT